MSINLRTIDLNLLVIFEALYATRNTSRAAERLGMSQPAVSNALARLRDLIGDPLFVRQARGLRPSLKAQEIIVPVRDALAVIGRQFASGDTIDLPTYQRLFRIIIVDPLEMTMMPKVVQTIATQAPGITIECVQASGNYADLVRSGDVDLACMTFPTDTTDLVIKPISTSDLVVISRRNHPGISKPLGAEALLRLPHMVIGRELRGLTGIEKNLVVKHIKRRMPYAAAKIWSVPPMVSQTDLIAFLPRDFAIMVAKAFELDIHEVPIPMENQTPYMMWHVNSELDPGHRWLRESMMAAVAPAADEAAQ